MRLRAKRGMTESLRGTIMCGLKNLANHHVPLCHATVTIIYVENFPKNNLHFCFYFIIFASLNHCLTKT